VAQIVKAECFTIRSILQYIILVSNMLPSQIILIKAFDVNINALLNR